MSGRAGGLDGRLEGGEQWPDWETYDRIERLFGWPRSFRYATRRTLSERSPTYVTTQVQL